jgi:hypothetical protein
LSTAKLPQKTLQNASNAAHVSMLAPIPRLNTVPAKLFDSTRNIWRKKR